MCIWKFSGSNLKDKDKQKEKGLFSVLFKSFITIFITFCQRKKKVLNFHLCTKGLKTLLARRGEARAELEDCLELIY